MYPLPLLAFLLVASALPESATMPKVSKASPADASLAPLLKDGFLDVQEATLANGLRVRLLQNSVSPTISLYTFFRVGSRNERPGITGISHLFEHMMFNGSKKFGPKEFDRILESRGGHSNAYTSSDVTVYYEDFASESLETVLDLESDRMRSLAINDKALAAEREVVKEERRSRVDNEIIGLMDEELGALVFKAHPYRWPVIGWMKDIENISKQDCLEYFRTYYAPNNATLWVVGDLEPKKTLALIKKYYGTIKKGPPAPAVIDAEPEQRGARRALIHHPAQAPSLLIGFRGPPAVHEDTTVLDVLQYALSVGESSRLMKELVYKRELAVSVAMDWSWRMDPGMLLFVMELAPDAKVPEVEQAFYGQLEAIAKDGLSDLELQKAKNNLKAHLLRELATNNGRANALGTYEVLLGSWRSALELHSKYQAVTGAQVKAAAAKYFAPARRSVVELVPSAEPEAGAEGQ